MRRHCRCPPRQRTPLPANTSRVGAEFQANGLTVGGEFFSDVATFSDGGYVVAYTDTSYTDGEENSGIRMRVFDANGNGGARHPCQHDRCGRSVPAEDRHPGGRQFRRSPGTTKARPSAIPTVMPSGARCIIATAARSAASSSSTPRRRAIRRTLRLRRFPVAASWSPGRTAAAKAATPAASRSRHRCTMPAVTRSVASSWSTP